jgi:hypothetical protein
MLVINKHKTRFPSQQQYSITTVRHFQSRGPCPGLSQAVTISCADYHRPSCWSLDHQRPGRTILLTASTSSAQSALNETTLERSVWQQACLIIKQQLFLKLLDGLPLHFVCAVYAISCRRNLILFRVVTPLRLINQSGSNYVKHNTLL